MKLFCALVGAAVLGAGGGLRSADEPARMPAVMWMGAKSLVTTARFERITTRERWEEVWHEHTGEGRKFKEQPYTIAPEIDFGLYMVIARFTGPTKNCDGERVEAVDNVDGAVRIRFDSITYQTASFTGEDSGVSVLPFGLWVIERTTRPVVIEQNVQGLLNKPPVWKEQHRFETLEK